MASTRIVGDLGSPLIVNADGKIDINEVNNITGTVSLPTGAATESTLNNIDSKDFATETTLDELKIENGSGFNNINTSLNDVTKIAGSSYTIGDKGIIGMAVRHETQTSLVNDDHDYTPLSTDSLGNLRVVSAGEVDSITLRLGKSFTIERWEDNFGTGNTLSIHIQTGSIMNSFLTWSYDVTLGGTFEVYEGGSITGGTAAIIHNRDRQSLSTSDLVEYKYNATRVGGTQIIYKPWGAASQKANVAGDSERWILEHDTYYHFIITSSKPTNLGWLELNWYEEVS